MDGPLCRIFSLLSIKKRMQPTLAALIEVLLLRRRAESLDMGPRPSPQRPRASTKSGQFERLLHMKTRRGSRAPGRLSAQGGASDRPGVSNSWQPCTVCQFTMRGGKSHDPGESATSHRRWDCGCSRASVSGSIAYLYNANLNEFISGASTRRSDLSSR